jgi:preprotein translocase subunit SecG
MTIFSFITFLIIIVCVLLILVVLVQNSKGGGLAANFASAQIMGVRKTADFLEKATWTLASVLVGLCIIASISMPRQQEIEKKSLIDEQVKNAVDQTSVPNFPTSAPENNASNQGQKKETKQKK